MSTLVQLEPCENEERLSAEQSLTRAFACFTGAAGSLERSYQQLEAEVVRLRRELEERNAELARSLKENQSIRNSLRRIVEGLPCGVLVVDGKNGQVWAVNPVALRLLYPTGAPLRNLAQLHSGLLALLDLARKSHRDWELETWPEADAPYYFSARHASVGEEEREGDSVFILQDVTSQKRYERERERERLLRQQALAEMSAVLAHEIRNPLGSLELLAGLLAESDLAEEPCSIPRRI